MTTKDLSLNFLNGKQSSIAADSSIQYNSINLNQNNKWVSKVGESSKNSINDSRKECGYDASIVSPKNKEGYFREKFMKSNFLEQIFPGNGKGRQKDVGYKSQNSSKSSTLSLHIAAYEKSVEGRSDSNGIDKNGVSGNVKTSKGLPKKWKSAKQLLKESAASKITDAFEYPRQQREADASGPEIMQFKASQQLLNSNQCSTMPVIENMSYDVNNCTLSVLDEDIKYPFDRIANEFLKSQPYLKIVPPSTFPASDIEPFVKRYIQRCLDTPGYGIGLMESSMTVSLGGGFYGLQPAESCTSPMVFENVRGNPPIEAYLDLLSPKNLSKAIESQNPGVKTTMSRSIFSTINENDCRIPDGWNLAKLKTPIQIDSRTILSSGAYVSPILVEPLGMPKGSYLLPGVDEKLWIFYPAEMYAAMNTRLYDVQKECPTPLLHNRFVLENGQFSNFQPIYVLQKPNEFMVVPPRTCYQFITLGNTVAEEVNFFTKTFLASVSELKRCACKSVTESYQNLPEGLLEFIYEKEDKLVRAFRGPGVVLKKDVRIKRVKEMCRVGEVPYDSDADESGSGTESSTTEEDEGDQDQKRRSNGATGDADEFEKSSSDEEEDVADKRRKSGSDNSIIIDEDEESANEISRGQLDDDTVVSNVDERQPADTVSTNEEEPPIYQQQPPAEQQQEEPPIYQQQPPAEQQQSSDEEPPIYQQQPLIEQQQPLYEEPPIYQQKAPIVQPQSSDEEQSSDDEDVDGRDRQQGGHIGGQANSVDARVHPQRVQESQVLATPRRKSKPKSSGRTSGTRIPVVGGRPTRNVQASASVFHMPSLEDNEEEVSATHQQNDNAIVATSSAMVETQDSSSAASSGIDTGANGRGAARQPRSPAPPDPITQQSSSRQQSPRPENLQSTVPTPRPSSQQQQSGFRASTPQQPQMRYENLASSRPSSQQHQHVRRSPPPVDLEATPPRFFTAQRSNQSPRPVDIQITPSTRTRENITAPSTSNDPSRAITVDDVIEIDSAEIVEEEEETETPAMGSFHHKRAQRLHRKIDDKTKYSLKTTEQKKAKVRNTDAGRKRNMKSDYSKWFSSRLCVIKKRLGRRTTAIEQYRRGENLKEIAHRYGDIDKLVIENERDANLKEYLFRQRDLVNIVKAFLCEERPVVDEAYISGFTVQQLVRNFINQHSSTDMYLYSLAVEAVIPKENQAIYKSIIGDDDAWNKWFEIVEEDDLRIPWKEWEEDLQCDPKKLSATVRRPMKRAAPDNDDNDMEDPRRNDIAQAPSSKLPRTDQVNPEITPPEDALNPEITASEDAMAQLFPNLSDIVTSSLTSEFRNADPVELANGFDADFDFAEYMSDPPFSQPEHALSENTFEPIPIFRQPFTFNSDEHVPVNNAAAASEDNDNLFSFGLGAPATTTEEPMEEEDEGIPPASSNQAAASEIDHAFSAGERSENEEEDGQAFSQVKWDTVKEFVKSSFKIYNFDFANIDNELEYGVSKIQGSLLKGFCSNNNITTLIFDQYLQLLAKEYTHCAIGKGSCPIPTVEQALAEYVQDQTQLRICFRIFLAPIFKNEHFITFVADVAKRMYYCYDSLDKSDLEEYKVEIAQWKAYAEARFSCKLRKGSTISSPLQINPKDSGLLGCIFAERKLRQSDDIDFMELDRKKIVAELLNGQVFYPNVISYEGRYVAEEDVNENEQEEEEEGEQEYEVLQNDLAKADARKERIFECQKRLESVELKNEKDFITSTYKALRIFSESFLPSDECGMKGIKFSHLEAAGTPDGHLHPELVNTFFEMLKEKSTDSQGHCHVDVGNTHTCQRTQSKDTVQQNSKFPSWYFCPMVKDRTKYVLFISDIAQGLFYCYNPSTSTILSTFQREIDNLRRHIQLRYNRAFKRADMVEDEPPQISTTDAGDKICNFAAKKVLAIQQISSSFDQRKFIIAQMLYGELFYQCTKVIEAELVAMEEKARGLLELKECSCFIQDSDIPCEVVSNFFTPEFSEFIETNLEKYENIPPLGLVNPLKIPKANLRMLLTEETPIIVIQRYMELLSDRGGRGDARRCLIGSPRWGKRKFNVNDPIAPLGNPNNVITRIARDPATFTQYDYAITCLQVPAWCDRFGKQFFHHVLIICNLPDQNLFIYDPMGMRNGRHDYNDENIQKEVQNAKSHLEYHLGNYYGNADFNWQSWSTCAPKSRTHPVNNSSMRDSAIYALTYAEQYSRGIHHISIQNVSERRRGILAELVAGRLFHKDDPMF